MILSGDLHANARGELQDIEPDFLVEQYGQRILSQQNLIILGDGGFLWHGSCYSSEQGDLLKAFDRMPWTTYVVPGNHENFAAIYTREREVIRDGQRFWQISDKVFYFSRFGSYHLEGRQFLVLGGALSIDYHLRTEGISYFREELFTEKEQRLILQSLPGSYAAVLAHTLPSVMVPRIFPQLELFPDPNSSFFSGLIKNPAFSFPLWACGHFHANGTWRSEKTRYEVLYGRTLVL